MGVSLALVVPVAGGRPGLQVFTGGKPALRDRRRLPVVGVANRARQGEEHYLR
ncbi:MAG: hypothetical protein ABSB54_08310 [Acidimicrobiales bacterium]